MLAFSKHEFWDRKSQWKIMHFLPPHQHLCLPIWDSSLLHYIRLHRQRRISSHFNFHGEFKDTIHTLSQTNRNPSVCFILYHAQYLIWNGTKVWKAFRIIFTPVSCWNCSTGLYKKMASRSRSQCIDQENRPLSENSLDNANQGKLFVKNWRKQTESMSEGF